MKPAIEVLGAYRVEVDEDLISHALAIKYEGVNLAGSERELARRAVEEELAHVVLIEVVVRSRDERFEVGDFCQPDSHQAAYDEAFLFEDGTSLLSRTRMPNTEPLRLAFFIHGFNPALPLETSYGSVETPALQSMPRRLQDLMPYEPVD